MHVSALTIHPLKSGAVRPVRSAPVGPAGLATDRTWMVVDGDGQMVSARELPDLFRIVADTPVTDPSVTAALRLRAAGQEDLSLEQPTGVGVPVRLFSHPWLTAVPAGPDADDWVCRVVGTSGLRLVWCDAPGRRILSPAHTRPGDHTAFADAAPVTLVSQASLEQVNAWVAQTAADRGDAAPEPLPMARFRPSVVVAGGLPFEEDAWSRIRIAGVPCRVVAGVARCVMTTIDPGTLARGKEPIRTLATHRRWEGKTWFARQVVPDGSGVWAVGDEVEVLGST